MKRIGLGIVLGAVAMLLTLSPWSYAQKIKALADDGMTMVIVTHEMQFAREVAHRIVFLDAGHVVEEGVAKQLLSDPQTPRLQAFLRRFREGYLL